MLKPLLRARGGISTGFGEDADAEVSSPRTRRYFRLEKPTAHEDMLFSAHAEVFLAEALEVSRRTALLRARGGISL